MLPEKLSLEQKLEVASNTKTCGQFLEKLAQDDNVVVRSRVANNPNTPPFILDRLARDRDCVVCYGAINNPKTPVSTLEQFIEAKAAPGLKAARTCALIFQKEIQKIKDPLVSLEQLVHFSTSSSQILRAAVAKSVKAPEFLLKDLARDRSWYVRKNVASNINITVDILTELSRDLSNDVCQEAIKSSLRSLSGVREVISVESSVSLDLQSQLKEVPVGFLVALELGYLNLETVVFWADSVIEKLENQDIWVLDLSCAKTLKQVEEILTQIRYCDPRLKAEFYIGLRCIPWMGTPWLRKQLSIEIAIDRMCSIFIDLMKFDRSYEHLYETMTWLQYIHYSADLDNNDIASDKDFIEAQKLCLTMCEKAKALLAARWAD